MIDKNMNSNIQDTGFRRGPNFTWEEQEILTHVLEPYLSIIESKKTEYIKQTDKRKVWAKITEIYNANTTGCSRTTNNLISCYRNMKTKVKKQQSEAKMLVKDPSQTEALITVIEDNGKDWPTVSKITHDPLEVCQMGLEELKYEELVLDTVDAEENLVTCTAKTYETEISTKDAQCHHWETSHESKNILNGTDTLKKKSHSALIKEKREKLSRVRKSANDSFVRLTEEKIELVKLNQELAAEELKEKKLNVHLKEIEINHKKKLQELELENLFKENVFKEEMRRKELELIDLKTKKIKTSDL